MNRKDNISWANPRKSWESEGLRKFKNSCSKSHILATKRRSFASLQIFLRRRFASLIFGVGKFYLLSVVCYDFEAKWDMFCRYLSSTTYFPFHACFVGRSGLFLRDLFCVKWTIELLKASELRLFKHRRRRRQTWSKVNSDSALFAGPSIHNSLLTVLISARYRPRMESNF